MTKHYSKSKSSSNLKHKTGAKSKPKNNGKSQAVKGHVASNSYNDFVIERFKNDPKFLKLCLAKSFNDYIKTNDKNYFTVVLDQAIKACGVSKIAKETKLSRQTIYAMSSKVDTYSLHNFQLVMKCFGLNVNIG